jgi:hypothetical protein
MIYLSSQILNEHKDILSFQLSEEAKSQLLAILLKRGYKVLCNVPNQNLKEWVGSFEQFPEMILDINVHIGEENLVVAYTPFRATQKEFELANKIAAIVGQNMQCPLFNSNAVNLIIDITVKSTEDITGIINTIGQWLQL